MTGKTYATDRAVAVGVGVAFGLALGDGARAVAVVDGATLSTALADVRYGVFRM